MSIRRRSRKVLLPLLNALRSVKPKDRVIILAHLTDSAKDHLYETINYVLKSEEVPFAKRLFLKNKLGPYKDHLRYLAAHRGGRRGGGKNKKLAQIGGGPMTHVLGAAIPLLLNIYAKQ